MHLLREGGREEGGPRQRARGRASETERGEVKRCTVKREFRRDAVGRAKQADAPILLARFSSSPFCIFFSLLFFLAQIPIARFTQGVALYRGESTRARASSLAELSGLDAAARVG